jgi:glycosyltransferase involved in cell wall biosynthesis
VKTLISFAWLALIVNWMVALAWIWRVTEAIRGLSSIPDLFAEDESGETRTGEVPRLCVVVPARNEEKAIEATLLSLLEIEGLELEIVAVDDRSTDATGKIMDRLSAQWSDAARTTQRLRVIHITDLPAGWMGKTHAMAVAARTTTAPWLLFTDGDVQFRHDSLARAMRFAERERADHLVLFPTLILRSWGERMMIGFLQAIAVWTSRPWRVGDPSSRRDFLGIGAFNMIRREVYDAMGGFEALRMEVLEDLRLGYEVKRNGFSQRVVFGHELIRIHWGEGAFGIVNNLTKNAFAVFRFRVALLMAALCGLIVVCIVPFFELFWDLLRGGAIAAASVPVMLCLVVLYRFYRRFTGSSVLYAFTFPLAALLFLFAILKSLSLTLFRGGVMWRGTLYPLRELRKQCGPLW